MFNVDDLLFEIPFFKVNKQKWNEKTRRMRNSGVEPSLIRHFRRKEGWWRHNSTIGYVYIFKHFDKLGAAYSKRDRKLDRRPYRGNFEWPASLDRAEDPAEWWRKKEKAFKEGSNEAVGTPK